MEKIENLKKVTLQLEAGTSAEQMDLQPAASPVEFIFGIGPQGLCPFEYQLANRVIGEQIELHVKEEDSSLMFEHLHPMVINLFEKRAAVHLKVKILEVTRPESTEVIKALSKMASHQHDCGCGCGC